MKKIEGGATFPSIAEAQDVLDKLTELRHDEDNALIGGGQALHQHDDGSATVTVSYRLREGTNAATVAKLQSEAGDILGEDLTRGEILTDTEHVFDAATGQIVTRQANRVVQVQADGSERVLTTRETLGDVTHPETGEKLGQVPIRSVYDADGNQIRFDGPRGEADPSVTVEKN